jgi:phosphoglycerate dehydrogenase-like enzyme
MTLPDPLADHLRREIHAAGGELVFASKTLASNLIPGEPDALIKSCDVAFGQPDPRDVIDSPRVMWVHINTAGYTRYDNDHFREAIRARRGIATNSSEVYSEPCAEHLIAFMMARARALPAALKSFEQRHWNYEPLRRAQRVVAGDSAVVVGYGAIGQRLVEVLQALRVSVLAIRRTVRGDESIPTYNFDRLDEALSMADHVFNTLPSATGTKEIFNARRFERMKRGAAFYNVGRGDTVDQHAPRRGLDDSHTRARPSDDGRRREPRRDRRRERDVAAVAERDRVMYRPGPQQAQRDPAGRRVVIHGASGHRM